MLTTGSQHACCTHVSSFTYLSLKSRAFSLLELVLVLGIMVVLAAVAMPRYANANVRYRIEFAARRVAADLSLAMTTARTKGQPIKMTFVVESDSYTISGVDALDGSGNYTVSLAEAPYHASIIHVDIGGDALLTINGWGNPDADGVVRVTVGSEQRDVKVDSLTGEVTIE